ncbi:uncharacterized protein LOC134536256 isoform X2 [Bacillus rossius redtenbacheri]|uniref:uncharacterized protein LOC134536256 isoform X2 n=1 Tax=Bacillus rossius redtenbacheri TaxID=93214 RepID=UPI002FDE9AF2
MAPLKPRLNSTNPGGRNVGAGSRLNQSRMRLAMNSVSGSGSRNKSTLYGKVVKRNSSHLLRKNNVALAKALNTAKQQNAELNTLVMQYRERLHVSERLVQEYQDFRRDMRALFDQYPQRVVDQNESDYSSTEPASQAPLLPRTERKSSSDRSEYQAGVREARTQLVNPMVQGMSISKVKVCLERINDVPRSRPLSLREPGSGPAYAPEPNQRASLQEAAVRSSPGVAARSQRQDESRSPVNDDITMDFTMVQQLRPSGGQFVNSLRVPSLTLQRLSLQDIQRTTSAHLDDAVVELSTEAQSPQDRSGSVQLKQSIYLAEGDSVTSRQSVHEAASGEHDAIRNPELPSDGGGQTEQSPANNPLEGSSWMFDNNCVSRRIKMRDRRSKRKRYSVKTLAAKESFSDAVFGNLASPKSDEEAAPQDMSLTLCLPAPAACPRGLLEPVRTKASVRPRREDVEAVSPVAAESAGRSPTVALTRLFEADLYRLPPAEGGDGSDSDEDICISLPGFICTAPPAESPRALVDVSSGSEKHASELAKVVLKRVDGDVSGERPADVRPAVTDDVADEAKSVGEEAKPVDAGIPSVAEKPADAETPAAVVKPSVKKSRGKSRCRRTNSRIEQAPELHLPTRQAKKSGPGVYKEPPLNSKLRR